MKMQNFSFVFTTVKFWPYMRPDSMNRTSIYLNNELVWPLWLDGGDKPPVMPAPGVKFRLEIPSGTLTGVITDVVDVNDNLDDWEVEDAVWEGKYAGLTYGKCAIGRYTAYVNDRTIVETSIADEVMTYDEYATIRCMAVIAGGPGRLSPEKNQALMRSAWEHLQALRKEAERLAAEQN